MKETCTNILSIKFTDSEYYELKQRADAGGYGLSTYIKTQLFPNNPPLLTTERITKLILAKKENGELSSGDIFTLRDLFKDHKNEYQDYPNKSPAGKKFWNKVCDINSDISKFVEGIGGKPAKFRVK